MEGRLIVRVAGLILALALACSPSLAQNGKRVGAVSTTFRVLGANDRILVDRYDDPKVDGVSCYMSHAATGGVSGSLGVATDPSRFSIACRATGKVAPHGDLPANEVVFGERQSLFFKQLRISRLYDPEKRVLVYLAWSTKTMSTGGSPFNSVSAVPLD